MFSLFLFKLFDRIYNIYPYWSDFFYFWLIVFIFVWIILSYNYLFLWDVIYLILYLFKYLWYAFCLTKFAKPKKKKKKNLLTNESTYLSIRWIRFDMKNLLYTTNFISISVCDKRELVRKRWDLWWEKWFASIISKKFLSGGGISIVWRVGLYIKTHHHYQNLLKKKKIFSFFSKYFLYEHNLKPYYNQKKVANLKFYRNRKKCKNNPFLSNILYGRVILKPCCNKKKKEVCKFEMFQG